MRSIVRRDTGESYNEFLEGLAKASGIETPTKSDLIKVDKTRKNKASNDDWQSPSDPDAGITKMKNGSTHLAHKAEHAVDLDTDAIVAINVYPGHAGDTATGPETLEITVGTIEHLHDKTENAEPQKVKKLAADKGYHSDDVLKTVDDFGIESYIASKDVARNFEGKPAEKKRYQANERRLKTQNGDELFRRRSEKTERSMAHMYLTGAMRRCWLRGHGNIIKRLMIHAVSFNLGLIMRKEFDCGTPRGLAENLSQIIVDFLMSIAGNFGRITSILNPVTCRCQN
ncbi:MAG: transposase [FCB group bacterium]|nr:transposase [FCB group bacterium]